MTDDQTAQDVHLKDMPISLEYEATGEFRRVQIGEYYSAGDYLVGKWKLAEPTDSMHIILRRREPQPGPWQENWEWTGEVCLGKDVAGRVATSQNGKSPAWSAVDYTNERSMVPTWNRIYFILRPKPSLAGRLREVLDAYEDITARWRELFDSLYAISDDIDAREKVIAEVVKDLRAHYAAGIGQVHNWADRLEGKD